MDIITKTDVEINTPDELQNLKQWLCHKAKVPHNPRTLAQAQTTNPATWGTLAEAQAALQTGQFDGLGIVLADGLAGVDLDHVRDPETGIIEDWALDIIRDLDSYAEVSPSGTGVHILCFVDSLPDGKRKKGKSEIYNTGRFFTFTGEHLPGTPATVNERTAALATIHAQWVAETPPPQTPPTPPPATSAGLDDRLQAAFNASNGAKIQELFAGGLCGYDSPSEADAALCGLLAFYSSGNATTLEDMMLQSQRRRDKWQEKRGHNTWLSSEVNKAITRHSGPYWVPGRKHSPSNAEDGNDSTGEPIREQLIALAEAAGTCIRTPLGERYFAVDGELLSLAKGGPVRRWLVNKYREATGKTPNNTALTEALYTLEADCDNGPAVEVNLRIAQRPGVIYLDLGKRVVCCTADEWLVIDPPGGLHFLRPAGQALLPTPDKGGHLRELDELLPVCEEKPLLVAWVLGALMPSGPYPVLCLSGEQGSGKSTVARILRYLVDPKGTAPGDNLSRPPKDEKDLWVSAGNQHVLAFDNLTRLSSDLSDALSALSTGASYEGRKLYTDSETSYISACRPTVLTAIGAVAVRGDLLDRSLQVALPRMTQPQGERDLWEAVEQARPRILGALCDCICAGIKYQNTITEALPRMADFTKWILAIEKADLLPWAPGDFMATYLENRTQAQAIAAGASILTDPLLRIATAGFTGTAGELLEQLKRCVGEDEIRNRDWPKTAAKLGTCINELAPALRGLGVEITHTRPRINGKQVKIISINLSTA